MAAQRFAWRAVGALRVAAFGFPPWLAGLPLRFAASRNPDAEIGEPRRPDDVNFTHAHATARANHTGGGSEREQVLFMLCTTAMAARRFALRAVGALRVAAFGFPPWLAGLPLRFAAGVRRILRGNDVEFGRVS